jgi:hypothetical protein
MFYSFLLLLVLEEVGDSHSDIFSVETEPQDYQVPLFIQIRNTSTDILSLGSQKRATCRNP